MRPKFKKQLSLSENWLGFEQAQELGAISRILDQHPNAAMMVWQDLAANGQAKEGSLGAGGLSGGQVLRALVVKQLNGFSYRELAFHLADSSSYSKFCELAWGQAPSKSTLAACIKAIQAETLEQINRLLVGEAKINKIDDGKKIRVDTTVVESNIHEPLDSNLLFDSVRVLTRLMRKAQNELGSKFVVPNRTGRAKRRALGILNARTKEKRKPLYRDLVRVTEETIARAHNVITTIERAIARNNVDQEELTRLRTQLSHHTGLASQVVDQTRRRVFAGQSVPAREKIVSIFEEHTDVIVKDRRATLFGHKICLSTGKSSLILDCTVLDGNPADVTLAEMMIDRHIDILGSAPRQAAYDGGFTSQANLEALKAKGVKDVAFSKARSLSVTDMVRSHWVYKKLRDFRAGIEATISFLKRCFGLDRCTWKSLDSFKSYVWSSVVSFNLLLIARHQLQT
ncbi:MAG: ISNCY family transposase [Myxococcales bacterium]|nr:MAG: ISNCY family transposase [Myxococcales bacterium]